MTYKIYENVLPATAEEIRRSVFMDEQGFQNEFDSIDNIAAHIVLYNGENVPIATCRVFLNEKSEDYVLGRLAVIKEFRGKNIGAELVNAAEQYVRCKGGKTIILHAQCRVSGFYQRMGFAEFGETDDDEGCPHIWMRKDVSIKRDCL